MKKLFNLWTILALIAFLSGLTGCNHDDSSNDEPNLAVELPTEEALFTAGTFTGVGQGWGGEIIVEVEFSENEILSIEIRSHTETPGLSDPAFDLIPSQITQFQSLGVDAISGATETVDGIVEAVSDAVEQADGNVEALLMIPISTTAAGEPIYREVDVVVIGGGGAGMSAAVAALDAGADVLILEKTAAVGGNTLAAGAGILAWNAVQPDRIANIEAIASQTPMLEEFLEFDPDTFAVGFDEALVILQEQITEFLASDATHMHFDSIEFHLVQTYIGSIRYELDGSRVYSDYDLTSIMIRDSLASIEWLEALGGEFRETLSEPGGAMWRRGANPYTNNQVDIFDPMLNKIGELGGELMLNTRAEALIVEGDAVVGVTATQLDGTPVTVNASSVIVATGGFAANREMVADYNNFWENFNADIQTTNVSSAVGDGIIMAQEAGADVTQMGITQLMPMAFATTGYLAGGHQRGIIYVDANGRRFVNEVNERDTLAAAGFSVGGTFFEIRRQVDASPSHLAMAGDGSGRVYLDDTIAGLAEQVGIDPDVLVAEVQRFNEFVANGYDEDFGRVIFDNDLAEGPWMIRVMAPSTHYTNGGLLTTTDARVVNTAGEIIPNLFAAGEVMGGIHGGNRLGGNAVAEAFVFGRIAGENAAINAQ